MEGFTREFQLLEQILKSSKGKENCKGLWKR